MGAKGAQILAVIKTTQSLTGLKYRPLQDALWQKIVTDQNTSSLKEDLLVLRAIAEKESNLEKYSFNSLLNQLSVKSFENEELAIIEGIERFEIT